MTYSGSCWCEMTGHSGQRARTPAALRDSSYQGEFFLNPTPILYCYIYNKTFLQIIIKISVFKFKSTTIKLCLTMKIYMPYKECCGAESVFPGFGSRLFFFRLRSGEKNIGSGSEKQLVPVQILPILKNLILI